MSCPRCGSRDIWDDNLSWGCESCGYMENDGRPSFLVAKDKPGLPRSVEEMKSVKEIKRVDPFTFFTPNVPYPKNDQGE